MKPQRGLGALQMRASIWLLVLGCLLTQGFCSAKEKQDSKKLIFTLSVSLKYHMVRRWRRWAASFIPRGSRHQALRDRHKGYHMQQPINSCVDPIEMVRSGTLCSGENTTYFRDLLDELIENTAWSERVYCCLHEETNGAYARIIDDRAPLSADGSEEGGEDGHGIEACGHSREAVRDQARA